MTKLPLQSILDDHLIAGWEAGHAVNRIDHLSSLLTLKRLLFVYQISFLSLFLSKKPQFYVGSNVLSQKTTFPRLTYS